MEEMQRRKRKIQELESDPEDDSVDNRSDESESDDEDESGNLKGFVVSDESSDASSSESSSDESDDSSSEASSDDDSVIGDMPPVSSASEIRKRVKKYEPKIRIVGNNVVRRFQTDACPSYDNVLMPVLQDILREPLEDIERDDGRITKFIHNVHAMKVFPYGEYIDALCICNQSIKHVFMCSYKSREVTQNGTIVEPSEEFRFMIGGNCHECMGGVPSDFMNGDSFAELYEMLK